MGEIPGKYEPINNTNWLLETAFHPYWNREKSRLLYDLPVPVNRISRRPYGIGYLTKEAGLKMEYLNQLAGIYVYSSPMSHIGPYNSAMDIIVADGTPVLASQKGKVVRFQDQFDTWGTTPEYSKYLNFITLQHENGEFSEYGHLMRHSINDLSLDLGDEITKGQRIGTVGKTGWTTLDHLHFMVFREDQGDESFENKAGFKSLAPRFAAF